MAKIRFDPCEQDILRYLAKQFSGGEARVSIKAIPHYQEQDHSKASRIVQKFENLRLVEWKSNMSFDVLPGVLDVIDQLDTPPQEDYRKKAETWFWSKPWSIVVLILLVGIPAIVGYIEAIRTILSWLGVTR